MEVVLFKISHISLEVYGSIKMGNKKVTLSIEEKVYKKFQKYCNRNAIMLSKKIELFMAEEVKK